MSRQRNDSSPVGSSSGPEQVRLNKVLADAGICSRREADRMIAEGRVTVNGQVCRSLGVKVDPLQAAVAVNGQGVETRHIAERVYLAFNKPRGVVSSMKPQGKPEGAAKTLADFMPGRLGRMFPVGRLDRDSQGLVIMTNDGELAHKLLHPSSEIERVYHVTLDGKLSGYEVDRLRAGHVSMPDGERVRPMDIDYLDKSPKGNPRYQIVLREGKKREIRELMGVLKREVKRLKRIAYGPIEVGAPKVGHWRMLTRREVLALREAAGAGPLPANDRPIAGLGFGAGQTGRPPRPGGRGKAGPDEIRSFKPRGGRDSFSSGGGGGSFGSGGRSSSEGGSSRPGQSRPSDGGGSFGSGGRSSSFGGDRRPSGQGGRPSSGGSGRPSSGSGGGFRPGQSRPSGAGGSFAPGGRSSSGGGGGSFGSGGRSSSGGGSSRPGQGRPGVSGRPNSGPGRSRPSAGNKTYGKPGGRKPGRRS